MQFSDPHRGRDLSFSIEALPTRDPNFKDIAIIAVSRPSGWDISSRKQGQEELAEGT